MPKYVVTSPDGRTFNIDAPEGATHDDAIAYVQSQLAGSEKAAPEPTREESARASLFGRFSKGVYDPLVGAGQLIAHGLSAGEKKGTFLGNLADSVDRYWQDQAAKQDAAVKKIDPNGSIAGSAAEFVGNVASPTNALLALKGVPASATMAEKVLHGMGIGAAAGAMQPVTEGDYATTKAAQAGTGAAFGGGLTAVASPVADAVIRKLKPEDIEILGAKASLQADDAVREAEQLTGAKPSPEVVQQLRQEVIDRAKNNEFVDAAALLRKKDFDALNMPHTRGQMTRDPAQYSSEQNLRGVSPEIASLLRQQPQRAREIINLMAQSPSEKYQAGQKMIEDLQKYDDSLRSKVTDLYKQARESEGKDLTLPMQGLAQDYARVLDDFGDKIPGAVRKRFEDYGLMSGKQLKTFDIEEADKVSKLLNSHMGNDNATNEALRQLKTAVKTAVTDVDATGGPFAPAVKAAADRFKQLDEIPGLDAASTGKTAADDFVQKYLINGKTDQVRSLANVMSPDSKAEAKAQIVQHLYRSAFGEDAARDAGLRPDGLAKAMRSIGTDKLKAFLSDKEIDDLNRLVRVSAYIEKDPAAAFRNRSNTTVSALAESPVIKSLFGGIANSIPGGKVVSAAASAGAGAVKNKMAATTAMDTTVPFTKSNLTPAQEAIIQRILGGAAVTGGAFGSGYFK